MKDYLRFLLLMFSVCVLAASPVPANSSDLKDVNRQALGDLLNELDQKIKDADKRMIAHPKFLKELQVLVDKYRGKLRKVFLKEDFVDGDYTKKPKWQVISGHFKITPSRRLWSQIVTERPIAEPSSTEKPDLFGIFLKEVMKSKEAKKVDKRPSLEPKEAFIRTFTRIGPAFEVDLVFVSESRWGSMEIIFLGGQKNVPRYRMIYHAAPSSERPIEIIRERDTRSYLIESATKYPFLDDGSPHRIQWIRNAKGNMKVLVDGKEVLSTMEIFYKDNFTGIALINRGGIYEWGPIHILEASH